LLKEVEERKAEDVTEEELTAFGEAETSLTEKEDRLKSLDADIATRSAAMKSDTVTQATTAAAAVTAETSVRGASMEQLTMRSIVREPEVRDFIQGIRDIGARRAITNVELLVPDILIGFIQEKLLTGSIISHVNVIDVHGNANLIIAGASPDGVWLDCCGDLTELSIGFNNWTFGCYGVGGYFAVCNAMLEDSDINLAQYIIESLHRAIQNAVEKAILNGTGTGQPMGITTRLAQTSAPASWLATAPAWTNLSTTNVLSIDPTATPEDFFTSLAGLLGSIANVYTTGNLFWVMNTTTYATILAKAIGFNASGAVVANGGAFSLEARSLPLIGGVVVIRDWVAANTIIGGYGDGYTLVRRAGTQLRRGDEIRMLNNQTVFAGFARYDGYPVIANAFVQVTLTA
jgi:HK97 family phage major capsid protein